MLVWEEASTLVAQKLKYRRRYTVTFLYLMSTEFHRRNSRFDGTNASTINLFFGSAGLMITDADLVPPKEDADKTHAPAQVRKRSRSRNREDGGIVATNSHRRAERSGAMALTDQHAIMIGGLQMQPRRLLTLKALFSGARIAIRD